MCPLLFVKNVLVICKIFPPLANIHTNILNDYIESTCYLYFSAIISLNNDRGTLDSSFAFTLN